MNISASSISYSTLSIKKNEAEYYFQPYKLHFMSLNVRIIQRLDISNVDFNSKLEVNFLFIVIVPVTYVSLASYTLNIDPSDRYIRRTYSVDWVAFYIIV